MTNEIYEYVTVEEEKVMFDTFIYDTSTETFHSCQPERSKREDSDCYCIYCNSMLADFGKGEYTQYCYRCNWYF